METRETYLPKQFNAAALQRVLLVLATLIALTAESDSAMADGQTLPDELAGLPAYLWPNEACAAPSGQLPHESVLSTPLQIAGAFSVDEIDRYSNSVIREVFRDGSTNRRVIEQGINFADPAGRIIQTMGFGSVDEYISQLTVIPGTPQTDAIIFDRGSWASTFHQVYCSRRHDDLLRRE